MLMMNTVVLACLMMVIYGDCRWKMSPDNLPTCLTWDINSCPVAPVSRHDFRPHPGRRSDTRSDGKKISASYRILRWFIPYWITWFTYVYLVCCLPGVEWSTKSRFWVKSVSVKVPESKAGMCKFTKLLHAWAHSKKHLVWLQPTSCVVLKKSSVMLIHWS